MQPTVQFFDELKTHGETAVVGACERKRYLVTYITAHVPLDITLYGNRFIAFAADGRKRGCGEAWSMDASEIPNKV